VLDILRVSKGLILLPFCVNMRAAIKCRLLDYFHSIDAARLALISNSKRLKSKEQRNDAGSGCKISPRSEYRVHKKSITII